jgi:hypothetical protein
MLAHTPTGMLDVSASPVNSMSLPGFKNTPVTKYFVTSLIASSTLTSLLSLKPYTHIQIVPHLLHQWQWWRIPIWMASYSNAGEVLFACLTIYNLRGLERIFGSRKYAVFPITGKKNRFWLWP